MDRQWQSYIGVSGVQTPQEVRAVIRSFPANCNRILQIGTLISVNTLRGEQNPAPRRFVQYLDHIKDILRVQGENVEHIIHFQTNEPAELSGDLMLIESSCIERAKDIHTNLHGFQINCEKLPPLTELMRFAAHTDSRYRIILEISGALLEERTWEVLAHSLTTYSRTGVITDVLFNSGGKGSTFFTQHFPVMHKFLLEHFANLVVSETSGSSDFGVGLTGGLGPDNIERLATCLAVEKDLSWVAESQLRDEVDDDMDIVKVSKYLDRSAKLLSR